MLLMIDNYDCFTYNLVQYFGELGEDVRVFRNDEITLDGIAALKPDYAGAVARALLAGRGRHLRRRRSAHFAGRLPILGVCLGHQAIGAALGGRIVRAKAQMHGKTSVISTDERGVYAGLPRQFTVIRYHSLVIERASLPAELEVTLDLDDDGEIMGVRHRELAGTRRRWKACSSTPSRSSASTAMRC